MTSSETDLLVLEYQEINAHLRTNTTGFVNWFSFFLTFSLVAAIAFLVTGEHRQGLRGLALQYGVPIACLMLLVIALAGILIFRHSSPPRIASLTRSSSFWATPAARQSRCGSRYG